MEKKRERGRKRKDAIENRFSSLLKTYTMIRTVQMVIHTKDGREYTLNRDRDLDGETIVFVDESTGETITLSFHEIEHADVFAA